MKKTIAALFFAGAAAFCTSAQVPYKVIVPMHGTPEGTMIYLANYDTGELVDSAAVADEHVTFTGDVDEPWVGRVLYDGGRICTLIVEEGTVSVNREQRRAVGMMLNDQLNAIVDSLSHIEQQLDNAKTADDAAVLYQKYIDTALAAMKDNEDSPIGYIMFMEWAGLADANDLISVIQENPWLGSYQRVQRLAEGAKRKMATSEGRQFIDFEVEYDGKTQRLSDYVGRGKYTLVDFWASWCGPCIQEIKVIKEIYKDYSDKGLDVLGVAVWDKPEDTLGAIERLKLPWPVIINSQNIATDIYGIPAIPCIIVFGPDGKIVSRDKRGAELKETIAKLLAE